MTGRQEQARHRDRLNKLLEEIACTGLIPSREIKQTGHGRETLYLSWHLPEGDGKPACGIQVTDPVRRPTRVNRSRICAACWRKSKPTEDELEKIIHDANTVMERTRGQ